MQRREDMTRRLARRGSLLAAIAIAIAPLPAHALRATTWNLLSYPGLELSFRQPKFRTVMQSLDTDLLVVQELTSQAGRDSFLLNVLKVARPDRVWKASGYIAATESAVFWDSLRVSVNNVVSFATAGPRDVLRFRVKPVGYVSNNASFLVYSVHLKAGNTVADEDTRQAECTDIRNQLNTNAAGTHFLVAGDYNTYSSFDRGYVRLTESQVNDVGRCFDPIDRPGSWSNNAAFAGVHTQSACASPGFDCPAGFSGGGMDDRFDFALRSSTFADGEGLDFVVGGYIPYGNDGQHFNAAINGSGFNNAVGITVADALNDASDHLPVIFTFQVPAKVLAAAQLDFGSVLVGATAEEALAVSNPANPPADELTYSLLAPVGFTAPAGGFAVNAGEPPNQHTIGMSTASAGTLAGMLTVSCDDPDSSTKPVLLSGKVLRHAIPSLDSLAPLTATTLDFGDHTLGQFTDQEVRLHNVGYDPLQARLDIRSGQITGGAGRFSIVGGFKPALLGGVGTTYNIHFDDFGATQDSTYEATLVFGSADESLPGSATAPDLVVALRASQVSGGVDVPAGRPTALRFYSPRPNPTRHEAVLSFDLPQRAPVSLGMYDLSGRRVATMISGTLEPNRYEFRWRAEDEGGAPLPAGLYFARFTTPGFTRVARIAVIR